MTKILIAARLSRVVKGKEQASIERQDAAATRYAADQGDNAPILAPDAGVSGSVSPFKRPKLGLYLTDPALMGRYTEIVASAMDRLGRNARDLAKLRNWCEDNGKKLTILSPRMTWPPAEDDIGSRLIWVVLAELAEIEWRTTRKRYADARQDTMLLGGVIGKPVWGFRFVSRPATDAEGRFVMRADGKPRTIKVPDPIPAKVPYLRGMIERAEQGASLLDIARWLDSQGAEPEQGGEWDPVTVSNVLRNPSLYGRRIEGNRVIEHSGLISRARHDALIAKLDARPKRRGPTRREPALLTDVVYCAKCRGVMHYRETQGRVRKDGTRAEPWRGYRCDGTSKQPSTCRNMVPLDYPEAWLSIWLYDNFGFRPVTEIVTVPATGHAEELAQNKRDIASLDPDAPGYDDQLAALRAERVRLQADPGTPAHPEERETPWTVAQLWTALDTPERRQYLIATGLKLYTSKDTGTWAEGNPARVGKTLETLRVKGA